MAFPPINIYSQNCDPEGTLAKLLEVVPEAEVVRDPDGGWTEVRGTWKRGWLKGNLKVKIGHQPDYYSGEGWGVQRSGMMGYVSKFPGVEKRRDLLSYIAGLNFSFNLTLDPEPVDSDPRIELAFEMARHVDGILFLPGRMLDGEGRVILDATGADDPDAVVPEHEADVHEVPAFGDEEIVLDPPEPERLVRRLCMIAALVERGFLEEPDVPDAEGTQRSNLESLRQAGALSEAEPDELRWLEAPIGSLEDKEKWALPWMSEGGMVIAWSLGLADLPTYDQQVDVHQLYGIAKGLMAGGLKPERRPTSDIEQLAFQMLAIHWRIREFALDGKVIDFPVYATKAWCGPMDLGLARIVESDLAIGKLPISQAEEAEWKKAGGIMEERRRAIHWVLGHHPVYSENDTAT